MYTIDRRTHGHLRWRRQDATFYELAREFPELVRPRWGARVPSSWDLPRHDAFHRSWKRHRRTQYRAKIPRKSRHEVKVTYYTHWIARHYHLECHTNERGATTYHRRAVGRIRFRVRDAYRRHRVE